MAAAVADGEYDGSKFIQAGLELLNPAAELEQEPNMPAAHIATMLDAQGPNFNCLTACAASSQAVGKLPNSFEGAMQMSCLPEVHIA